MKKTGIVAANSTLDFVSLTKSIFLPDIKNTIMSDIATRVKKIIVDKLGVDEAEVTLEASFYKRPRR